MKKVVLLATCLLVCVGFANAQKFKPTPDFLKGEKEINVVFDFSKVTYDGDAQSKYYKKKNKAWIEEWEGKRRTDIANTFISNINEELTGTDVNAGEYPDAKYTIIVDVIDCDFGSYAGPLSVPAKLQCNIRIVKTGSTTAMATVALKEKQSSMTTIATPIDFDRMFLSFGEMGEKLGEILIKILK